MSYTAPPGWYPDTSRPDGQRYWDGTAWTGHVATLPPAAPQLASFGQRLGASLLDGLTLGVPFAALGILVIVLLVGSMSGFEALDPARDPDAVARGMVVGPLLAFGGLALAAFVVPVLYGVGFEGSPRGQTIGKWAVGIRVVDGRTAGRLGPGRALLRVGVRSFASGFLALGYLWMLWDPQRRTWHDLAADSRVVITEQPRIGFGQLLRSWTLRS